MRWSVPFHGRRAIDATLIAAPSSTKNEDGERDPEMHQTKKCNQSHFGMKAHIGVDLQSGLAHTVVGTAANVNNVTQAHRLVGEHDKHVSADASHQEVEHPFRVIERRFGMSRFAIAA